jgi:hypothetical protein
METGFYRLERGVHRMERGFPRAEVFLITHCASLSGAQDENLGTNNRSPGGSSSEGKSLSEPENFVGNRLPLSPKRGKSRVIVASLASSSEDNR